MTLNTLSLRGRSVKATVTYVLLALLVMFIPLLIALCLTAVRGYNLFQAVPCWNDELWWYQQYADIAAYCRPLGYFGYAGTHADMGTFGPWGMFPTLLIGFLTRVFGWGLHAYIYYNFFFLALAALLFILLTRPGVRSLVMMAAANAVAYIATSYGVICMNESVRYAMALVLTGLMYRLVTVPDVSKTRRILRWTLIPLLLMYATCFYKILAAFIPVYLIAMLRRWKPVWRVSASLAATAVAVKLLGALNSLTACPYITGGVSFSFPTWQTKLSAAFYSLVSDLQNIDPFSLIAQTNADGSPALTWFCVMLYAAMGVLVWRLHVTARDPEKKTVTAVTCLSLWLLFSFWAGHVLLYTTSNWTFIRGCFTALYCVLFLSALMPEPDCQPWRVMVIVGLLGAVTFIGFFVNTFATADRFSTETMDAQWQAQAEELASYIELDEDASDPWANTVVITHGDTTLYYILPVGAGLNGASDSAINENARYVLVGSEYDDEEDRLADIQSLLDTGHAVLFETDLYTLLENTEVSYE